MSGGGGRAHRLDVAAAAERRREERAARKIATDNDVRDEYRKRADRETSCGADVAVQRRRAIVIEVEKSGCAADRGGVRVGNVSR